MQKRERRKKKKGKEKSRRAVGGKGKSLEREQS